MRTRPPRALLRSSCKVKLTERIAELCLKVGRTDTSWCKKLRLFCRFNPGEPWSQRLKETI